MATSKDVAALAGVSQSTVSYVMSGTRSISDETRTRVEAAMSQLGYHPNAGARALASRRTSVIGLMVRFSETTDMAGLLPFIDTITAYARSRDYDVVLVTSDEGPAGLTRMAGRSIVDAIVLMDIKSDDDRLTIAKQLAIPTVLIGVPDDPADLDCVDFDTDLAGRLAVRELASTGHDQVLLIDESPVVSQMRYGFIAGFTAAVEDETRLAGVDLEKYTPSDVGWAGFHGLEAAISAGRARRLGIIARSPQAIDRVLQVLLGAGIEPGVDVSVVGLCTDATATAFRVQVSNVSPEPREVSRLAMDTLFDRLAEVKEPGRVRLVEPRLTRRATTIVQ